MSFRVLSLGVPPQERSRLCMAASKEVCLQAAHYARRAAQVSSEDAAAEPYVRAVYTCQASTVRAERVSIASAEECGSYLRSLLRASLVGAATNASVPCWLTVMLDDTCIVQHAVFALTADSQEPHMWTSMPAFQADGGPFQPGVVRWSLSAQPVLPGRAAPSGHVYTPPDAALAVADDSIPAPREVPSRPQVIAAPVGRSFGAAPCVHAARVASKAVTAATQAQQPQPATPTETSEEAPRRFSAPALAQYKPDASATRRSSQSSRQPVTLREPESLVVYDSPRAELVTPSDGRQWNDLAYRARYSPRREELWDIAGTVMTHNYAQAAIGPGSEQEREG